MDKRLQILERLYGEPDGEGLSEGDDDDVRREYQALSQVKLWLDHRKRERPEPATIDRVVEAAAAASRGKLPTGVRADRSPLRLLRTTQLRVAVAAAVSVVIVGVGLWRMELLPGPDRSEQLVTTAPFSEEAPAEREEKALANAAREDADAPDQTEVLVDGRTGIAGVGSDELRARSDDEVPELAEVTGERAARKSAATPMPSAMIELDHIAANEGVETQNGRRDSALMIMGDKNVPGVALLGAAGAAAESESSLPAWDEMDDVIRLRQRLGQLQSRQANLAWDKPVVPLEMMPTQSDPQSRIHQAGAREKNR